MLVDVCMAEERLMHCASPLRFVAPADRLKITDLTEIGGSFAGAYPQDEAVDSGTEEDINNIYKTKK
jgi:hypothetical protein